MVTVHFITYDNIIREVTVSGHANYTAAPGTDIVCAAISALTGGVLNGLALVLRRNDIDLSESDGYVHFVIPDSKDELQEMKTCVLTETYLVSMKEIEESYEKYLKIYYDEN